MSDCKARDIKVGCFVKVL
jgi:phospholipid-transporting ATPase